MAFSSLTQIDIQNLVDDPVPAEACKCPGLPMAKLREAWTLANPARRFFNCAKSWGQGDANNACNYYRFVDPEVNKHYRNTLLKLKTMSTREFAKLSKELKLLKEKLIQTEADLVVQIQVSELQHEEADKKITELESEIITLKRRMKKQLVVASVLVMGFGGMSLGMVFA